MEKKGNYVKSRSNEWIHKCTTKIITELGRELEFFRLDVGFTDSGFFHNKNTKRTYI